MFSIRNEPFGPFEKYILQNLLTGEYVSIIPAFGGNVNELVLKKKDKLYSILDRNKTAQDLIKDATYKGAQLIPFASRIENGMYTFQGKTYQLPVNEKERNHALHGFLNNKKFIIVKVTEGNSLASLEVSFAYNKDVPGYPFSFLAGLIYSLSDKGFKIETTVKNTGLNDMPFSCGWHPYFTFSKPVDDLYLHLSSRRNIVLNERLIPTGKINKDQRFYKPAKIGSTQLDDSFIIENGGIAKTELYSVQDDTTISLWQETGAEKFNYLQVYIPPDRRSIAFEPVTSQTNAYNNGKGLIVLKPDETFHASYGVFIS
jgi:aldose 1-epimerase